MKQWKFRQDTLDNIKHADHTQQYENMHPFVPSQQLVAAAEDLEISPFLLHILHVRGLCETEEIQTFLSPHLRLLAPLNLWPGLPEAADILVKSIIEGKKIAVWGDYDVDGITSTSLVVDVLEAHGIHALAHLPNRATEGYGLNIPAIDALIEQGAEVLLTVDCGISDKEAIAHARAKGMIVVISDHHLPPEDLPIAHAICNPQLGPSPCAHLAGVGVAFFLMCAVNVQLERHFNHTYDMREVLDLVALGTLADVVSLQGQNRILVKNGLLKIASGARPGIAALKKICKFQMAAKLGAGQVVFTLAPRINAAGRMGHAKVAMELLRAKDLDCAIPLAHELDAMNNLRKKEEEHIFQEALEQAEANKDACALVLYSPTWHSGIIGIVASRIVDLFHKPTLILCDSNGVIKGSGRSIHEFHLHDGLSQLAHILIGYGGHKLAAGLSISPENLPALRTEFTQIVQNNLGNTQPLAQLTLDAPLDFSIASSADFLHEIELLQPFGMSNPEPVFASPRLLVKNFRTFGNNKEHIVLDVLDESTGISLQAKAWRIAQQAPEKIKGQYVYLAYTPLINNYNGVASIEVRIKDWKWQE